MHGNPGKEFGDFIAKSLPVQTVRQVRGLIGTSVGLGHDYQRTSLSLYDSQLEISTTAYLGKQTP